MSQIYRGELHDENIFAFFVLINFQLSAKHFSVLPCYFRGGPSDTASTFLKMASDFDAVITITDCQI